MTATDNPERQRQAARAFWALAEANRLLWDAINDGRDIESVLTAETYWTDEGRVPTGRCEIRIRIKPLKLSQAASGGGTNVVSTALA
jgi:hypothetical protein